VVQVGRADEAGREVRAAGVDVGDERLDRARAIVFLEQVEVEGEDVRRLRPDFYLSVIAINSAQWA
jgi:hypothetical protein